MLLVFTMSVHGIPDNEPKSGLGLNLDEGVAVSAQVKSPANKHRDGECISTLPGNVPSHIA